MSPMSLLLKELKRGVLFTAVTIVLFGVVYHLAIWGIGRVAFQSQAEGSLICRADGSIAGSRLIAQKFTRLEYFHSRPSAVDYNAAATGGSNFGPTNPDHLNRTTARAFANGRVKPKRKTASPDCGLAVIKIRFEGERTTRRC